jgi:hypothetical protein
VTDQCISRLNYLTDVPVPVCEEMLSCVC